MFTLKSQYRISLRVSVILGMSALTLMLVALSTSFVYAEEVGTSTNDFIATTTKTAEVPASMPYKTEMLLGDQVYGDFVLGPGKVELTVKPGESKTIDVTVSNRTGTTHTFDISTEDISGSSDPSLALVLLGDDRGPYSLKDYIKVEAPRFDLPHNTRARIPVTITIPPDAEPGGLYGSLLVSTVTTKASSGGSDGTAPQSAVVARIGTSFFITIPGEVEKDGGLKDFGTIPKQSMYQTGPITFGVLFENKGSSHLAPYGELRIRNIFKEEVGFVELEPWFVLPKALRMREISWDRDLAFGRYTATAYINRSYSDIVDEQSVVFWVLPWKQISGVFVVVFLVLFLFRAFFRRFEFKRKS